MSIVIGGCLRLLELGSTEQNRLAGQKDETGPNSFQLGLGTVILGTAFGCSLISLDLVHLCDLHAA